jgi:hypothetical protein
MFATRQFCWLDRQTQTPMRQDRRTTDTTSAIVGNGEFRA